MLEGLVVEALLLDLATLIHRLHGAEYTASLRDPVKLRQHRFLDQLCQLLDDKGTL